MRPLCTSRPMSSGSIMLPRSLVAGPLRWHRNSLLSMFISPLCLSLLEMPLASIVLILKGAVCLLPIRHR